MPEQITKYPDVTLQVLKSAGAKCGEGAEQKILKQCPAERFCALPGGEICVYGIDDIENMTQIKPAELAEAVCPQAAAIPYWESGVAFAILGVGALIGWRRRHRS